MVGYSMGAGIAVSFAAHQPHLVSSLILMAPGGLYRTLPAGYSSIQLRYPRLFPSRYLQSYIRKLLNGTPDEPYSPLPDSDTALSEEQTDTAQPGSADLLQKRQPLDVVGIVNWEIEHCPGFVPSVINALKHAPLVRQDATWRLLRSHLVDHKADGAIPNRLRGSQVLILLGSQDTVLGNDFPSIASDCLGRDTIIFASFDAGHDFPVRLYEEVGETIAKYLGLGNGVPVFDDL
jgi:pimeloyl-ACP methyl ester carboxylesterase